MGTEPTTPGFFTIEPGDVLADKYVVERTLGVGGMGLVVAARHVTVQHRVALKFLLPGGMSGRVAAARFLREARAATAIQSEHVVRVMDLGTLDTGAPYLVMEYLEGMDLARLLVQEGALSPSDAVDYVLQALVAIAEAHALGIVHRDLKPSNVFLTQRSDGSPLIKVLDFGISKAMSAEAPREHESLTRSGGMIGSPSYMAPEQIRSARNVDARADIWSLGVILHELVTGKPPFTADQVSGVLAAIVADRPTTPRGGATPLPRGLEQVILKCLEKDPADRYPSARELAEALAPFASAEARPLVARIAGITLRKGRLVPETQIEGTPFGLGDARPHSPTGGAWTRSLAHRSGRFGVRTAIGVSVIALAAVAIMALRVQSPTASDGEREGDARPAAGASHDGRARPAGEDASPSRVMEPTAVAMPSDASTPNARPSAAVAVADGVLPADTAATSEPTVTAVSAGALRVDPAPLATSVGASTAPPKKKRAPQATPPQSVGSGTPPRPVSEIVLDRR